MFLNVSYTFDMPMGFLTESSLAGRAAGAKMRKKTISQRTIYDQYIRALTCLVKHFSQYREFARTRQRLRKCTDSTKICCKVQIHFRISYGGSDKVCFSYTGVRVKRCRHYGIKQPSKSGRIVIPRDYPPPIGGIIVTLSSSKST